MAYEKIIGVRTDKTIYKDGSRVIKKFDHHYKKSDVLNEALNLAKVEETDLLVPKLLGVYEENNHWIIELSYIEGKSLQRLMQEQIDKYDDYLEIFVDLQIQVHQTKAPVLNRMKDKLGSKIEASDLPATKRMALRLALEKKTEDWCFCHGDFFPANIIMGKDQRLYIIDWAHATIGPKYADIANTYLDLWIEFDQRIAKKYLSIYIEKTNANQADILSWLPILAASRSIKGIKDEKEFLIGIANQSQEV